MLVRWREFGGVSMVAELDVVERDAQINGMKDPHPATLSYINSVLANLRHMLVSAKAFNPHEVDAIVDVIGNELRTYGEVETDRLAAGLYAKSLSKNKSRHIAEMLTS
jgi:hypothetical protein